MRRKSLDKLLTSAAVALALGVLSGSNGLAQSKPEVEATAPQAVPATSPATMPAASAPVTKDTSTTAAPTTEPAEKTSPTGTTTPAASMPADKPAAAAPAMTPAPAAAAPAAAPEPSKPTAAAPAAAPTSPAASTTPVKPPANATATTAPATPVVTKDTLVADQLRELANGKFDRLLGGKKERANIEAFYSARNYAPLWTTDGLANQRAKAAIAYLAGVDADGLDPADYPVPVFKDGLEPDALAEAELKLTQSVLTYAHHALRGRVHFTRVDADIDFQLAKYDPAEVLGQLANSKDVAATLDGFEPQQPGYKALKAKLAEVRHAKPGAEVKRIPTGAVLRLVKDKKGKLHVTEDARVPLLRARLGVEDDATSTAYDKPVVDAVIKFQKAHHLPANGQLNAATIEAINGPRHDRDADIIMVNLERWRWLPRKLGNAQNTYVMVNVPDYTLSLVHDGKLYWKTKIVAGKPGKATPMTSAEMKYITVNPTWNVPPSIIKNEYLPALQQDPHALERIGLKVVQNPDGTVRIYQPPGDRNALGRIRFNFPNKFLVYQHDTPDKYLFAKEKRAYSHGCMRVENPLMYGEKILSLVLPNEHYTAERLHKMFGGSEININFPNFIPVHLTYQTAFVDDDGKLQIRDDVYGRDAKMLSIMKGPERRVADMPMERARTTSSAPVRMPPGTFGTPYASRGPSLFDFLFGGPQPQQPTRPARRVSRGNPHNVR